MECAQLDKEIFSQWLEFKSNLDPEKTCAWRLPLNWMLDMVSVVHGTDRSPACSLPILARDAFKAHSIAIELRSTFPKIIGIAVSSTGNVKFEGDAIPEDDRWGGEFKLRPYYDEPVYQHASRDIANILDPESTEEISGELYIRCKGAPSVALDGLRIILDTMQT